MVPSPALVLTPAGENQPPEGSPGAGRLGGQEAGQVHGFHQQPAEVGHGGEMGGGHRDLAQNLWAGAWLLQSWTPTGAPTPLRNLRLGLRGSTMWWLREQIWGPGSHLACVSWVTSETSPFHL